MEYTRRFSYRQSPKLCQKQLPHLRARIISGFISMYFAILKKEGEISNAAKTCNCSETCKEISKSLGNASTTMRQIFVLDICDINRENIE